MSDDKVFLVYGARYEMPKVCMMTEAEAKEALRVVAAIGYVYLPVSDRNDRYEKVRADVALIARPVEESKVEYHGRDDG